MSDKRIIEGRWKCGSCETKGILGRHKVCPRCGSPREAGEMSFDFGPSHEDGSSTAETVNDAEGLDLAGAGADWICLHCDAGNRGDASHCDRCSADRSGALPPPPTTPATRGSDQLARALPKIIAAPLTVLAGAMGTAFVACAGFCGINGYLNRDVEVRAQVESRTWIRNVTVERLKPRDVEGWKEKMPQPAGLPGSEMLSPGLGKVEGCEARKCWPRPPASQTLARVVGPSWTRRITTDVMNTRSKSGWEDSAPRSIGSMPSGGRGGSEGATSKRCNRKQKTPERCHNVSKQEQCGTTRSCTVVDKGNGFAEEVCSNAPKYCTTQEEVCKPAVYDQWCSWTELSWSTGREVEKKGVDTHPSWPAFSVRANERSTQHASYKLLLNPLAGPPKRSIQLPGPGDLATHEKGALVYAGASVTKVPATLIPRDTDRVDCGDGIDRGVLTSREWCRYENWSWASEPPLEATLATGAPPWPDGKLGEDGRETRDESIEVELIWTRGEHVGARTLTMEPEAWENWPVGAGVPVVVDADARFLAFPE